MASAACVNNITMSPYGWFSPPPPIFASDQHSSGSAQIEDPPLPEIQDPVAVDFEFRRLDDPVTMLPADELFSDGKLVPLQVTNLKPSPSLNVLAEEADNKKSCEISGGGGTEAAAYVFSPKAPRCSSRWKDILGLKKLYPNQNPKNENQQNQNPPKLLKHFLHRAPKSSSSSCNCSSLYSPLLKDTDSESVSILSSSSSSSSTRIVEHEHQHQQVHHHLPRLSFDSEKLTPNPFVSNRNNAKQNPSRNANQNPSRNANQNAQRMRAGKSPVRREETGRGVSVDSPRMNSSGKIVFQSLERSSSSPSSFNGGPRLKHRGMERSYSANVRVTPVINVPVCSLPKSVSVFGFGNLFSSSPQKKDGSGKGQQQQQQAVSGRIRSE